MKIRKATLKSFNSSDYKATVQLSGDYKVYLEDVAVAKNIAAAEMVAGRRLAVLLFDQNSPKEAVVIAVYS
jgi:hypothetical protein